MTEILVDAEAVEALGQALRSLAADLSGLPGASAGGIRGDGVPTGCTSTALDDLHGNFELARSRLAVELDDLGLLAQAAGQAYVEVDAEAGASFGRDGERPGV